MGLEHITLFFLRNDGKREATKLSHHTLAQARSLVEAIMGLSNGRYTEVDICTEIGRIETVRHPSGHSAKA
jgi:hypothetical protein